MQHQIPATRTLVPAHVHPSLPAVHAPQLRASAAVDTLATSPVAPAGLMSRELHLDTAVVDTTVVAPAAPAAPVAALERAGVAWHDSYEVAISKPHLQPYAHRTFMGLAGSMLRDSVWSACLQRCMPKLHAQCTAPGVSITCAMRLLEGNPVLAAYGLWRGDNKALPMEWDLWLDPQHPADLSRARVIHGNALATTLANSPEGRTPEVAEAIMHGARPGTDVHEGLTPLAWIAAFQKAALCGELPLTCSAVYLDVKSSWSSAGDLAGFIAALQQAKVETRGVLAFNFDQLAAPVQVPHAVHLTHGPAGLALALPHMPHGASAMFNGGALLDARRVAPSIDAHQLDLVRQLRASHGLRLGVYLQEDAVSPEALRVLIDCLNDNADAFTGGIAYGGVAGVAEGLIARGTGVGCQSDAIALENATLLQAV